MGRSWMINVFCLKRPANFAGQTCKQNSKISNLPACTRDRLVFLVQLTEIRLYIPFSDWFGTKRNFVWFILNQSGNGRCNFIWVNLTRIISTFLCVYMLVQNKCSIVVMYGGFSVLAIVNFFPILPKGSRLLGSSALIPGNFTRLEFLQIRRLKNWHLSALWEPNWSPLKHLKTSRHQCTEGIWIDPPLCRESWTSTLRKLNFHFLSHWMGYDRGDSIPFDFEPNGIPFGSKSKGNCHHNHIPFA